jgi:hypothetical protein
LLCELKWDWEAGERVEGASITLMWTGAGGRLRG